MDLKKGQEERAPFPGLATVPLCCSFAMLISAPLWSRSPSLPLTGSSFSFSCLQWSSPAASISFEPQEALFPSMLFCPDSF